MTVRLRPMRWWDVEPVTALERALFPVDAWTPEQFWSELAWVPESRHYLVAEDADRLVGYAGLATAGHDADVQTVAVDTEQQGGGVGTMLLTALLDEAARRDCSRVFLEVRADNAAALGLYLRHGFERIGTRRDYYAPGVDAVVMRRVRTEGTDRG